MGRQCPVPLPSHATDAVRSQLPETASCNTLSVDINWSMHYTQLLEAVQYTAIHKHMQGHLCKHTAMSVHEKGDTILKSATQAHRLMPSHRCRTC